MNAIDTATSSVANYSNGAASTAVTAQNSATTTTAQSATPAASATSVTPALAAATTQSSSSVATQPAHSSMGTVAKVMEAVVSVLQAMVGLVSTLVSFLKPGNQPLPQPKPEPAPGQNSNGSSGANGSSGSNGSSGASGSSGSGSASNSSNTTIGTTQETQRPGSMFDVTKNDAGMVSVRTIDGYIIRTEGRDQAWTITGPDGKTTRIWGDPHVQESDGDKWDFLTRSTFRFGVNKATVEVVPAGNGTTFSSRVTIYTGDERVTIDGIDKNKPEIVTVSRDGKQHDDGLADGISFTRGLDARGETWTSNMNNKVMAA
jgi:hypothetical protein